MKEQLQQIQAVAIVTFLCVLISVHSDGDYGKWFVVDGVREDITKSIGNSFIIRHTVKVQNRDHPCWKTSNYLPPLKLKEYLEGSLHRWPVRYPHKLQRKPIATLPPYRVALWTFFRGEVQAGHG